MSKSWYPTVGSSSKPILDHQIDIEIEITLAGGGGGWLVSELDEGRFGYSYLVNPRLLKRQYLRQYQLPKFLPIKISYCRQTCQLEQSFRA